MYKRLYLCHNILTSEFLHIGDIDSCPPLYLKNIHHLIMRLNYNPREEGTVNETYIRINCFKEILEELTTGNYLQPQHGVYIVDYTYHGLDEEIDSCVDVHEVNAFSPDHSSNSTNTSSSSGASLLSLTPSEDDFLQIIDGDFHQSTDEDSQQYTDQDSQQSTDVDRAMYFENDNEE
ncbi:unnamed protein product [Diamesa hyperborea]